MVEKIKRRELLTGVASAAVLPGSVRPQLADGDLVSLSLQFQQLIERTQELELRTCQSVSDAGAAWKAWSDAIDKAEALSRQLQNHPAHSLLDLSLKFDALLWDISHDGPDESSIDKLRVWGDDLKRLAGTDTHSEPSSQRVNR